MVTSSLYSWLLEEGLVKAWIFFIALFYLASIAGSTTYAVIPEEYKSQFEELIYEYYGSKIPTAFNPITFFFVILVNNAMVAILTWLLSITIIFPAIVMIVNGFAVGFIVPLTQVLQRGVNYPSIFLSLAPHGVLEVPALALVSSAFTLLFFKGFRGFLSALPGILVLALSMIFVAAIIESTVSLLLGVLSASLLPS